MPPIIWSLDVGQAWPSMEEGCRSVQDTILVRGKSYHVLKADKRAWVIGCRSDSCFFRVHLVNKGHGAVAEITVNRPQSVAQRPMQPGELLLLSQP